MDDDPREIHFSTRLIRQSEFAEEILALFKEIVLDEEYDERLRRHYRMVKSITPDRAALQVRSSGPSGDVIRAGRRSRPDNGEKNKRPRGARIGGDGRTGNSCPFPTISASLAPALRFACRATRPWPIAPA